MDEETPSKATLQISLTPSDWRHARYILPHQLRVWAKQVNEVLFILDLKLSQGRFGEGWEEGLEGIQHLIYECCEKYPNAYFRAVDYSPKLVAEISDKFFGVPSIPAKDFRGGPFYACFFGLFVAKYDDVFHIDSDMMFGGGSSTWIAEAVQLLRKRRDILVCSPLPGPPTSDGQLRSQTGEPECHTSQAFRFSTFTGRLFLLNRSSFAGQIKKLSLSFAPIRGVIKAVVEGNCPYDLPENIFTRAMKKHSLFRIDFLGEPPGMWSLHPPFRSDEFYGCLPKLIERIENGEIPDGQRGYYDINDNLINWTNAKITLRQNRWWKRIRKKLARKLAIPSWFG